MNYKIFFILMGIIVSMQADITAKAKNSKKPLQCGTTAHLNEMSRYFTALSKKSSTERRKVLGRLLKLISDANNSLARRFLDGRGGDKKALKAITKFIEQSLKCKNGETWLNHLFSSKNMDATKAFSNIEQFYAKALAHTINSIKYFAIDAKKNRKKHRV